MLVPLRCTIYRATLALAALVLIGCQERTLVEASAGREPRVLVAAVQCRGSRAALECAVQGKGVGASVAQAMAALGPQATTSGASGGLLPEASVVTIGGNGIFLRLNAEVAGISGTTWEYRVALQNLLPQVMGLTAANVVDPNGVRVYLDGGVITTTTGTGTVTPLNAAGIANFPGGPASYWMYPAPLGPGQITDGQAWRFNVPASVESFSFAVYVSAELADETEAAFFPPEWTFSAVSSGGVSDRMCAIRYGGTLYCWGGGMVALGTGDDLNTRVPTKLELPAAASMVVGYSQACMLTKADSTAYCWGYNQAGELGDGGAYPTLGQGAPVRVRVPAGVKFQQLAAGTQTTCGLSTAGAVWCWGNNTFGEFGNGTRIGSLVPVATTMPSGVTFTALAMRGLGTTGRNVVCGLTATGTAYCWGYNVTGLVGNGTAGDSAVVLPTAVTMPAAGGFASLALGANSACAIGNAASTRPGRLYCWGPIGAVRGNGIDSTARTSPSPIDTLQTYQQVSSGDTFTCAIRTNKQLVCWGMNTGGRTGQNVATGSTLTPTAASTAESFEMVASGGGSACAATAAGAVHCWGANTNGQVGVGDRRFVLAPTPLASLSSVAALAANAFTQCALTTDGEIYCAGYALFGQIRWGAVSATSRPRGILSPRRYRLVTTGTSHTCAINTDDRAECWGLNGDGQLGDAAGGSATPGGVNDAILPHEVSGTRTFFAITAGQSHTCALARADSTAYCWGRGGFVGDGSGAPRLIPTATTGGVKFFALAATSAGTCGLRKSDSTAFCWGPASTAGLGVGDTLGRTVPTAVTGTLKFRLIAGGFDHWCGARSTNQWIYCWGRNDGGQINNPSAVRSLVPDSVRVSQLNGYTNVNSSLAAGNRFTCFVNFSFGLPICFGDGLPLLAGRSTDIRPWAANRVQVISGVNVIGGSGSFVVAAGSAACVLYNPTGFVSVQCRGGNASGQLGRGFFSVSEATASEIIPP